MKDATVLHAIFLVCQPRKKMCTGCGVDGLFAGTHSATPFRDITKNFHRRLVAWDDDQHDNGVHAVFPTGTRADNTLACKRRKFSPRSVDGAEGHKAPASSSCPRRTRLIFAR